MDIADYPWEWAPVGFEAFDLNGSIAINAGASGQAFPAYTIPVLQEGWITGLGIELSSYGAGTSWSLNIAGKPIRDYSVVTVPIGAPNTPVKRRIKLMPNQPLTLTIVNATANPLAARWSIYGWYYPQRGAL